MCMMRRLVVTLSAAPYGQHTRPSLGGRRGDPSKGKMPRTLTQPYRKVKSPSQRIMRSDGVRVHAAHREARTISAGRMVDGPSPMHGGAWGGGRARSCLTIIGQGQSTLSLHTLYTFISMQSYC